MDDRSTNRGMYAMLTLHLICCGAPLLIFGVVSAGSVLSWQRVSTALPYLAIVGGLFAAGALYYYFAHGCRRCANPRPEREGEDFHGSANR